MQLTGTVHEVFPIEPKGKGQARNFIILTTETNGDREFKNYIKFDLWGDKCEIISEADKGKEVTVQYNLRGNRWEKEGKVNYFNSLQAWKVEVSQHTVEAKKEDQFEDDLPF